VQYLMLLALIRSSTFALYFAQAKKSGMKKLFTPLFS
jgi:hypothetical protein